MWKDVSECSLVLCVCIHFSHRHAKNAQNLRGRAFHNDVMQSAVAASIWFENRGVLFTGLKIWGS